jgi:hypothetical protein
LMPLRAWFSMLSWSLFVTVKRSMACSLSKVARPVGGNDSRWARRLDRRESMSSVRTSEYPSALKVLNSSRLSAGCGAGEMENDLKSSPQVSMLSVRILRSW